MGRDGGFTLLEVLVAFIVLAVSLGMAFEIFSTGLRGVEASAARTAAVLHTESVLASAGAEDALSEGDSAGEFGDGYGWRLSVRRFQLDEEGVETPNLPLAFVVRVTVDRADTPGVTLTTLRLAPR